MSTLPDRYIEVQLAFASAMAQRTGEDIRDVVLWRTNFARRFGFGPPPGASTHPEWQQYADTLNGYGSFDEQLAWTIDFARCRPTNLAVAHPTNLNVGPFSADVSGSVVRTHFVPSDTDGLSPLHPTKRRRRAEELVVLFDRVRDQHPEALSVRGVSWLYSTRTYQSLFPTRHIATATPRADLLGFQGSSSWGQFLDHRGAVKDAHVDEFISHLPTLDPASPWRAFATPTMVVDSPISNFDDRWRSGATL